MRLPHPSAGALCPSASVLPRLAGELTASLVPSDLKKQVESAELKNQRLKEVFQTKIQEFRKVCYTLTGYQVDITTENQYRLTSMYAEHKTDCLIFKVGGAAHSRAHRTPTSPDGQPASPSLAPQP